MDRETNQTQDLKYPNRNNLRCQTFFVSGRKGRKRNKGKTKKAFNEIKLAKGEKKG